MFKSSFIEQIIFTSSFVVIVISAKNQNGTIAGDNSNDGPQTTTTLSTLDDIFIRKQPSTTTNYIFPNRNIAFDDEDFEGESSPSREQPSKFMLVFSVIGLVIALAVVILAMMLCKRRIQNALYASQINGQREGARSHHHHRRTRTSLTTAQGINDPSVYTVRLRPCETNQPIDDKPPTYAEFVKAAEIAMKPEPSMTPSTTPANENQIETSGGGDLELNQLPSRQDEAQANNN